MLFNKVSTDLKKIYINLGIVEVCVDHIFSQLMFTINNLW